MFNTATNKSRAFLGAVSSWLNVLVKLSSSLVLSVLLVRALGQEDFGEYRALISLIMLCVLFSKLGLDQSLYRFGSQFYAEGKYGEFKHLLSQMFRIRMLVCVLFVLFLLLAGSSVLSPMGLERLSSEMLIVGMLLFVCISLGDLLGSSAFSARLEAYRVYAIQSIQSIIILVILPIGLLCFDWRVNHVISLQAALELIALVLFVFWGLRWKRMNVKPFEAKFSVKRLFRFSGLSYLASLCNGPAVRNAEQLVISASLSFSEVGLYGVAVVISNILIQTNPASLLRGVVQPLIFARSTVVSERSRLEFSVTFFTRLNIVYCLPILVVFLMMGAELVTMVFGIGYSGAQDILLFLCVAAIFSGFNYAYSPVIAAIEKPEITAFAVVFLLLGLVGGACFVGEFGVEGLAGGAALGAFLSTIYFAVVCKKMANLENHFPWSCMVKTAINMLPTIFILYVSKGSDLPEIGLLFAILVSILLYLAMVVFHSPFSANEVDLIRSVLPKRVKRLLP